VCGGAGFYLNNLILGLPEAPPSDAVVRAAVQAELAREGAPALFAMLQAEDPQSASRIHPNDTYRLTRALEVLILTGKPLSAFKQNGRPRTASIRYILVGLERDRDELYRRIDARCRAMFADGLAQEVQALYQQGWTPDSPGLKAIGYREFFIRDDAGVWRINADTDAVMEAVAANSRHYAKRQITYFKSTPNVTWLRLSDSDSPGSGAYSEDAACQRIASLLEAANGL
jgi:tRNA dimethylallyltransferase